MTTASDDDLIDAETVASDPRAGGRWRRRLAIAGVVSLILGVLAAGAVLGWFVRGWVPSGGVGTTVVSVTRPLQVEAPAASGTLPNVLGLGVDEARQAYSDAGVDASTITVESVPYVAQAGTVVEQRPPAAAELPRGGDKVELVLAEPARMPDLTGMDGDEARRRLAEIGVGATTLVRYESAVEPGQVARTRPAAGAPARPDATLILSEAPSSVDLSALAPESSDCSIDSRDVDGDTFDDALICSLYDAEVAAEYAINDRVSGFEGTLGLAEGAPARARALVIVRTDGREAARLEATASAQPFDVRVPGGSTLEIEIQREDRGDDVVEVVLGDARIVGARSGIDELAEDASP